MKEQQNSFLSSAQEPTKNVVWTVYIDGAARGNPGPSGTGIYALDHNGKPLIKQGFYIGLKTNNQAEYLALVFALFLVKKEAEKQDVQNLSLLVISDSELLIKQMRGSYKTKNPILVQIRMVIEILSQDIICSFKHVLREQNTMADKLANLGVDHKKKLPAALSALATTHQLPL